MLPHPNIRWFSSREWIGLCCVAASARCYTPARRPGWLLPNGSSWLAPTVGSLPAVLSTAYSGESLATPPPVRSTPRSRLRTNRQSPAKNPEEGVSGHYLRATQEDRRRAARR